VATTAILSALAEEQQGLLEQLVDPREAGRAGRRFWHGALHGQPVMLALSGIGKVAAATTATALIEAFQVERIVFTGVAGGLGDAVQVGDLVVATHFVQHDMDASPLFPRFEVPLYGQARFACDAMLTGLLLDAARLALAGSIDRSHTAATTREGVVHQGLIVSGDSFIATAHASSGLKSALRGASLDPLAVEMEGAAVAQVCHDYGVPFAAVRTISDRADDSADTDFGHFVTHVASRYALGIVDHLMRALAAHGQRAA
jgi:adenosylhomocysteine nucleosidase